MAQTIQRLIKRVNRDKAMFFCCDIQNGFANLAQHYDEVASVGVKMAKASSALEIPICASEYRSDKFRHTFNPIQSNIEQRNKDQLFVEKVDFSMTAHKQVQTYLNTHQERKQIVLFGLMTHTSKCEQLLEIKMNKNINIYSIRKNITVCNSLLIDNIYLYKTCLDLLDKKYDVFLCLDGCSSELRTEHECAFRTMHRAGAVLTSSSSVLFEMLRDYNDPLYERIRKIIEDHPTIENDY